MKRLYSVALAGLLAINPIYIPSQGPVVEHAQVADVSFDLTRSGSQVTIDPLDQAPLESVTIRRGDVTISQQSDGTFHDELPTSTPTFYVVSVEKPASEPFSQGVPADSQGTIADNADLKAITISTVPIPVLETQGNTALAATVLPTRTRFRYQTFITDYAVPAPAPACAPLPDQYGYPVSYFLGDNRSWTPDSTSFRTRSDVLIDWGNGGSLTWTREVGETTLKLIYPPPLGEHTYKDRASDAGLNVIQGVKSSEYVTFHMYSDVANPFCWPPVTRGIWYDLIYYVAQSGAYTVTGTIRQVPNHELYARDNVYPSWKSLMTSENTGFLCLLKNPFLDCINPIAPTTGDLVP